MGAQTSSPPCWAHQTAQLSPALKTDLAKCAFAIPKNTGID